MSRDRSGAGRDAGEARLRASVRATVKREGARVGFLLDSAGMVTASGGDPGNLEPTSFVSLAAAQLAAARDLAPIASGGDLSQLVQEGGQCRIVLASIHGGRTLTLLFDADPSQGDRIHSTGTQGPGRNPDVTEVDQAAQGIRHGSGDPDQAEKGLSADWSQMAEGEIDRIFRGEA